MDRDRVLKKAMIVNRPVELVWTAWTTKEGLNSFFASDCNLELKVGGRFEMFFLMDNEPGLRGSEGCQILAIEPNKMLSFTWGAPPIMPNVRKQRTSVTLRFISEGAGTRVSLSHYGWGESEEWTSAYNYFDRAWSKVLENLKSTLES